MVARNKIFILSSFRFIGGWPMANLCRGDVFLVVQMILKVAVF